MKKKLLALLLAMVMLLSCVCLLASCGPDDEPDGPVTNPDLDLNEDPSDAAGSTGITIITDPTDPEAGAETEEDYIHSES